MCRSPEGLRLADKLSEEAAIENSNATRSVSGVIHLDNAVFSNAGEQYVLLYIETVAEHT